MLGAMRQSIAAAWKVLIVIAVWSAIAWLVGFLRPHAVEEVGLAGVELLVAYVAYVGVNWRQLKQDLADMTVIFARS